MRTAIVRMLCEHLDQWMVDRIDTTTRRADFRTVVYRSQTGQLVIRVYYEDEFCECELNRVQAHQIVDRISNRVHHICNHWFRISQVQSDSARVSFNLNISW